MTRCDLELRSQDRELSVGGAVFTASGDGGGADRGDGALSEWEWSSTARVVQGDSSAAMTVPEVLMRADLLAPRRRVGWRC